MPDRHYPLSGCHNMGPGHLDSDFEKVGPRAVISGYTETGVSIMSLDECMDTIPVLLTKRIPKSDKDTVAPRSQRTGRWRPIHRKSETRYFVFLDLSRSSNC